MTAPITPYTSSLGELDPLVAVRGTMESVRTLTRNWTPDRFERSYAPGKWSARQIVTHLAQIEMALGTRVRLALTTPAYVAQPFDQEPWVARESRLSGADALNAFLSIAKMNLVLFEGLSDADRATGLSHPEYGALTVDWIIHQLAGHQINHLRQLETIGR
jgi:DinB family protein